jgi:hypothetical protein
MGWYGRLCCSCGQRVAAAVDNLETRVLCPACQPTGTPLSPADTDPVMTTGQLRDALADVMEGGAMLGQNLGRDKLVLVEYGGELYRLRSVKAGFRHGFFVLIMEAGVRRF